MPTNKLPTSLSQQLNRNLFVRVLNLSLCRRHHRVLLRDPKSYPCPGGAAQIINQLLRAVDGDRYLEIGVQTGMTLQCVQAATRVGIEPIPQFTVRALPRGCRIIEAPSDEYFASRPSETFDVIYVDGLHRFNQAYRDTLNSLGRVRPGGLVVIDDVMPVDTYSAIPDENESRERRRAAGLSGGAWSGDVWKVLIALDEIHCDEIDYRTITDSGRPRTIAWLKEDHLQVAPRPELADSLGLETFNFDSTWPRKPPEFFRPLSLAGILELLQARQLQKPEC